MAVETTETHLARLTRAAELRDTGLIAGDLAAYARRAGLDDVALAAELGCDAAALIRIKLCRLPRPEQWAADLERITGRFGGDACVLGRMLDQVQGAIIYLTLRADSQQGAEYAAAAMAPQLGVCATLDDRPHLADGGNGWVVYARLDLMVSEKPPR